MARSMETGWGSWLVFATLIVSSSVVLGLQWDKEPFCVIFIAICVFYCVLIFECDGGLRTWLLIAVCVTAVCGILGALFHGKGDGTRPSRFLDDDDDDDDDEDGDYGQPSTAAEIGMDLGPMDSSRPAALPGPTLPTLAEEGGVTPNGGHSVAESADHSVTSARTSSISVQLASRASSSLQHQYFGPGPKVFPDAIFLILVASQWFMAAWSIVGAVLYFRLFEAKRTCAPLLRHWTLLVVIMGFLSCLLAVCYSGIMCCMLGGPFKNSRQGTGRNSSRFSGDVASSNSDSTNSSVTGGVGMM